MSNLPDYFLRVVTGKYTTCKIHTELHQGPEWCIFHILTGEDMENTPPVKFIQNYIRDLSGVFSISSLVRISMM